MHLIPHNEECIPLVMMPFVASQRVKNNAVYFYKSLCMYPFLFGWIISIALRKLPRTRSAFAEKEVVYA
jgi:hypothetical protein